jgi:hypothetical protein
VITVHGIRTFGDWQGRLQKLLLTEGGPQAPGLRVVAYRYGYFSVLAFLVPFLRWLVTRRFRQALLRETAACPGARIDLVAHGFGTHLAAWGLLGIPKAQRPKIHTVILAGSVLKVGFSWRLLMDDGGVYRVINECGTRDSVLVVNQLLVLFTGMAGRVGFNGMEDRERFLNRYYAFGHSGYFEGATPATQDDFMRQGWLPLLLGDGPPPPFDDRQRPTVLQGLTIFLLNNAEPIKLTLYVAPFVGLTLWVNGLRKEAETQRTAALAAQKQAETNAGLAKEAAARAEDRSRLALRALTETVGLLTLRQGLANGGARPQWLDVLHADLRQLLAEHGTAAPGGPVQVALHLALARVSQKAGKTEDAKGELEKALELNGQLLAGESLGAQAARDLVPLLVLLDEVAMAVGSAEQRMRQCRQAEALAGNVPGDGPADWHFKAALALSVLRHGGRFLLQFKDRKKAGGCLDLGTKIIGPEADAVRRPELRMARGERLALRGSLELADGDPAKAKQSFQAAQAIAEPAANAPSATVEDAIALSGIYEKMADVEGDWAKKKEWYERSVTALAKVQADGRLDAYAFRQDVLQVLEMRKQHVADAAKIIAMTEQLKLLEQQPAVYASADPERIEKFATRLSEVSLGDPGKLFIAARSYSLCVLAATRGKDPKDPDVAAAVRRYTRLAVDTLNKAIDRDEKGTLTAQGIASDKLFAPIRQEPGYIAAVERLQQRGSTKKPKANGKTPLR